MAETEDIRPGVQESLPRVTELLHELPRPWRASR
jgi:hypothetical protein